jgi:Fe2+ or Zn2+ uptake regulation protein
VAEAHKIKLTLSPQAEKYVRRDAPVEVRRMAAGGALPLPPIELVTVLFVLCHDSDDQVKSRARDTVDALPENICQTVLSGETHPAVLAYLAHAFKDESKRVESIALNPATDDRTFAFLATLPHRRVIDIVANNQQRMLRLPEIVDALGDNPITGRATIDRILTFMGIERPEAEVVDEADSERPVGEEDISDEAAASALRALLGGDADQFCADLIEDHEGELDAEAEGNLYKLVQNMNVMQKIKLARMGNKEARGLLVRDRNKIVATAAIRSPKMTENEVEAFAKARNLSDEVLRIISLNREWTRSYQVKLGLATNPKVSVPTAMKFLNFLQERDLRNIMKSKDVATPIATHARRLLQKKGKI